MRINNSKATVRGEEIILEGMPNVNIETLAYLNRAFNHEHRKKIISVILENDNKLSVKEIFVLSGSYSQPATSQHLAILRAANLVTSKRGEYSILNGSFNYYSVNVDYLNRVANALESISEPFKTES